MSFLGMGTFEILIILLVAFIFLGPERMIDAARTLGKWTGELRRMGSTVQAEMDDLTNVGAPLTSRYDQKQRPRGSVDTTQPLDQDHPMDAAERARSGEPEPESTDDSGDASSRVTSPSREDTQRVRKEDIA